MAQVSGTAWAALVNKCFPGNKRIKAGKPRIIIKNVTGAPAAALGTQVGLLCWNSYDAEGYICTVVATTWVKLNA